MATRPARRSSVGATNPLNTIKGLQNAFVDDDLNGDGVIDFQEALLIDPKLYTALGLSNATELIAEFDENGDGVLDLKEQTQLLRRLLPLLEKPMKLLQEKHRFEEAAALRDNIAELRQQLITNDVRHARNVNRDKRENLQQLKGYESALHSTHWRERMEDNEALYGDKQARLEHKLELAMGAKKKDLELFGAVRPGMPLVPKYPPRVLELRALIATNSRAKNFEAAAVLKAECVALEEEAERRFAEMAPRALAEEERRLRVSQEEARKQLERKRIQADNMLRVERDHDENRIHNRHRIFNENLDHYSRLNLQAPVLRGSRVVLPPQLPHYQETKSRPFSDFETTGNSKTSMAGPKVTISVQRRSSTPKLNHVGRKDVPVRRPDALTKLAQSHMRPGTSGSLRPHTVPNSMGLSGLGSRPATQQQGPGAGGVGGRRGAAAKLPSQQGAMDWGWKE